MTDFDNVFRALDQMQRQIEQAAVDGLRQAAGEVTAFLQASDAYGDQTGATRAGSIAFVVTPEDDGSGEFNAAYGAVAELNPGHAYAEDAEGPGPDELMLVATVPTDYQQHLETANAGDHATLRPAMEALGPQILGTWTRAVEARLR